MIEVKTTHVEYENYRETKIVWLGSLPGHWGLKPVKHICRFISGSTPSKDNKLYWIDGAMPWVSPKDMKVSWLTDAQDHVTERALSETTLQIVEPGALLIVVRSGILQRTIPVAINRVRVTVNQDMRALVFESLDEARYFSYLVQGHTDALLQIWTKEGATVESIEYEFIANSSVPSPPLTEQQQIASFLDYETSKIDALIEKQQQLIALLGEKRQAVISHAVTKGLNPSAPMRDSGVEWLGEVPAHWEVLPTKRIFRLDCQPAPKNNDKELLSLYTDIGVRPRKELEEKGNKASTTDGYWIVKKGDLIVNKLLAWMGAVGHSEYDGVTSPAYDILRKTKPLDVKFYHYLFRLKNAGHEFRRWSRGIMAMRLRLYFEELGKIQVPFPPEAEQNEIGEHIKAIEVRFDGLAARAEQQIELLQERRTALISAVVTGKIDVRGWTHPAAEVGREHEMELA